MSVRPLLSIVVPVFNGGKLINACLNSIRIATDRLSEDDRARLEIIVCDNHSTDSTLATAKLASFPGVPETGLG